MVVRYREHVRTLEMVEVVSANGGDGGAFRDEDHVPPGRELDEACAPHIR